MHPLVSAEVADLDLLRALNRGMIPMHYMQEEYRKSLQAYVRDYFKEEVFDEGLTRNTPAFSRFFDAMGYSHGELTNYAKLPDRGVDAKTVKEYYQTSVDTLLGTMIEPYKRRQDRNVIRAGKFYLFDVGVAGTITHRQIPQEKGEQFGKAIEHIILMEILGHRATGAGLRCEFLANEVRIEVDFILGQEKGYRGEGGEPGR
jgi:predicted AAA+ superfamily ATPase